MSSTKYQDWITSGDFYKTIPNAKEIKAHYDNLVYFEAWHREITPTLH
jgi:hypothetical protein